MPISDRIEATVERWSQAWKERLRGWLVGVISLGIETFEDVISLKMAPKLKPFIDKLESGGEVPPEIKPLIDEIKKPTGEIAGFLARALGGGIVSGAMGSLTDWILRNLVRQLARLPGDPPFHLPKPEILLRLYWEYGYTKEWLYDMMGYHGLRQDQVDQLLNISTLRFPSEVTGPLWLRDEKKWGILWKDLEDLGVDKFRIEGLKELVWKVPSPQDIVTWLAREVFEPSMVSKYGLDDEWEGVDKSQFRRAGLRESDALNYWRAHWSHPAYNEVRRMLHRGQLTEQDVYDWFRLVEIPPYWRKGLTELMWDVPGRVELRMMAQYGLVDKGYIMDILAKDGLHEKYRSVVADMMLVRGARTDIQTRYVKGWLDSAGVQAEIDALKLEPVMAERMYKWIVKNTKGDRTSAEKDLTKAEIIKGVKNGIIEWEEGVGQLVNLGYDQDEATYLLAINVEVVEGVPTDELKIRIDTIRRLRRSNNITESDEIRELVALGIEANLARAYAENDTLRISKSALEGTPEAGA